MAGKTKNYTEEFKKQIGALYKNGMFVSCKGKGITELAKEYSIACSTVAKWVNDYKKTGSFKAKDNRSEEVNELLALRKELIIFGNMYVLL